MINDPEVRKVKAKVLMRRMGATPAQIFCGTLYALSGQYHVDPSKVELFVTHFKGPLKPGESLFDALTRFYGPKVARLAGELI